MGYGLDLMHKSAWFQCLYRVMLHLLEVDSLERSCMLANICYDTNAQVIL